MQHHLPDIVKSQVDGGGGRRARGHVVVEVEGRGRSDSGLASHKLRVRTVRRHGHDMAFAASLPTNFTNQETISIAI